MPVESFSKTAEPDVFDLHEQQEKDEKKQEESAKPKVPQKEQAKARIGKGKVTEQEHQGAEKEADRLLQRNGIPTEKEIPKTPEEFLRGIINVEQNIQDSTKENKKQAQEKLKESATALQDSEINDLIVKFNEQFIQANKDQCKDQGEEMKNKMIKLYCDQLKPYLMKEIDKKIADHKQELKDLETSFDQRNFSTLEPLKTYILVNNERKERPVTEILKKVDAEKFSPTKLLEAYVKGDQPLLADYQKTIQNIYKDFGLSEEEARQETKKIYDKQVEEFQKEIARREDLRRKIEKLQTHRNVIERLEGDDVLRYSRAVQGDGKAYDELKEGEKTKSLILDFEKKQHEEARLAIGFQPNDREWSGFEKSLKDEKWSFRSVKDDEGRVILATTMPGVSGEVYLRPRKDQQSLKLKVDPSFVYRRDEKGNFFPEAKYQEYGIADLKELQKEAEVSKVHETLSQLLREENVPLNDHLRAVLGDVKNCSEFIHEIKDYADKRQEPWVEALREVLHLLVTAAEKKKVASPLFDSIRIDINGNEKDDFTFRKWFVKSGDAIEIDKEVMQEDLRNLVEVEGQQDKISKLEEK